MVWWNGNREENAGVSEVHGVEIISVPYPYLIQIPIPVHVLTRKEERESEGITITPWVRIKIRLGNYEGQEGTYVIDCRIPDSYSIRVGLKHQRVVTFSPSTPLLLLYSINTT
jgi:hypothetical protein